MLPLPPRFHCRRQAGRRRHAAAAATALPLRWGGHAHNSKKEQVVRGVVSMTSVELQYITVYLRFGRVLVMDESNCKSSLAPPSVIRMVQWNRYIDRGKRISTMGMIDFWPEKNSNDFSSVKGSRHFPRVRFLCEQSYFSPNLGLKLFTSNIEAWIH
jgi:hypothetical protein